MLHQFRPIVLLGDAPILPRRQPHLQPDPTLDGTPLGPRLQLEPTFQAGRRDVLQRDRHAAEEIVLGTLPCRLAHLLEEPAEAAYPADLVQFTDRLQYGTFVVVIPDVQM